MREDSHHLWTQEPHHELDESATSRQTRNEITKRLYAAGLDMTRSLNKKIEVAEIKGGVSLRHHPRTHPEP